MTILRTGERKQAWLYPGPDDDPNGPYQVQFRTPSGIAVTGWLDLTAGVDPDGKPGFYVWVATAGLAGEQPGDAILQVGVNLPRVLYTSARLIDLDGGATLGRIEVTP